MNYYAMKALFASEDLAVVQLKLLKAMKQKKDFTALMEEQDRLADEVREFDRIARSRVRAN